MMRGIIETEQHMSADGARRLIDAYKAFKAGKIDLLILEPGMRYKPIPSARKRIRLAQSTPSTTRI